MMKTFACLGLTQLSYAIPCLQVGLFVAIPSPRGKVGHGKPTELQQTDPVQPLACSRGNPFPGQPVPEQLGKR